MTSLFQYRKRNFSSLFQSMQSMMGVSRGQSYTPLLASIFKLNASNVSCLELHHADAIREVVESTGKHTYQVRMESGDHCEVYSKHIPLVDIMYFLVGKMPMATSASEVELPRLEDVERKDGKISNPMNQAYIDGLFAYCSSFLKHQHGMMHAIDCYGSYVGVKDDLEVNIIDDIDYLVEYTYFCKHRESVFRMEKHPLYCFTPSHVGGKKTRLPLSPSSYASADDITIEDIQEKEQMSELVTATLEDVTSSASLAIEELEEEHQEDLEESDLQSFNTMSSTTSYTHQEYLQDQEEEGGEEDYSDEDDQYSSVSSPTLSSLGAEDETMMVHLSNIPVQTIFLEKCAKTLDDLIMEGSLASDEEWLSCLMQIIMTLLMYQRAFAFTHNDLHLRNVMCVPTSKPYLYYCVDAQLYRVPTYGRIMKIIDFGRSIFTVNGRRFYSDAYEKNGDAYSQYNTEPFFNSEKPRVDPNYSFDLCRLGTSLFDTMFTDVVSTLQGPLPSNPVKRLILEWCMTDQGANILFKRDGTERYLDFKLYKMIARHVHQHLPSSQLSRPEFKAYEVTREEVSSSEEIMNLDALWNLSIFSRDSTTKG